MTVDTMKLFGNCGIKRWRRHPTPASRRDPQRGVRIGLVRQARSLPDRDQLTEPPAPTTMRASLQPVDLAATEDGMERGDAGTGGVQAIALPSLWGTVVLRAWDGNPAHGGAHMCGERLHTGPFQAAEQVGRAHRRMAFLPGEPDDGRGDFVLELGA